MQPMAARQKAVASVEVGLSAVVRQVNLPRLRERMVERAGLRVDRAAYPLLRRIADEGPIRLSDLAGRLAVDVSTASRQVKGLEAAGLVRRDGDPDDGRASALTLTPAGVETVARLRQAWHDTIAELVADWPAADVDALARLLDRLAGELAAFVEGR